MVSSGRAGPGRLTDTVWGTCCSSFGVMMKGTCIVKAAGSDNRLFYHASKQASNSKDVVAEMGNASWAGLDDAHPIRNGPSVARKCGEKGNPT